MAEALSVCHRVAMAFCFYFQLSKNIEAQIARKNP